jgi:class 3 adenylate cyclase
MTESNKNIFVLDKNKDSTETASRKMAAIFAADVVGYSKLMAINEKLTLFRLKETRKITDKIISELNGRIFSTAGDSIMAEFASPVDAMEAAISIQKQTSEKIKDIKDNILIEFRIGINLGDIMTQDDNLYGDNVNIAARLESICPVGEIMISAKVYQEVEDKVDISFKYNGEKKLKNISKKIKVYRSQMTSENRISKSFSIKKIHILSILVLLIAITGGFYIFNSKFSIQIEYTDNSKSVLENFRYNQEDLGNVNKEAAKKGIVIAIMDFQNQSKLLSVDNINETKSIFNDLILKNEKFSTVRTPQGSENLNPPEVMLIATESNAVFVINGIIFDENASSYISLKIYEAKRGSLVVNQKILLNDNNINLKDFISKFLKDILKS